MIQQKIKLDIEEEFKGLRKYIESLLQNDFDIKTQKAFLSNHIPSEITVKSEILLDTLLNYLMNATIKEIEKLSIELQNDFFNQDFRNKIREWVKQTKNQFQLVPPQIEFASDPRWKQGAITGGMAFIVGTTSTVLVFDPTKIIWAMIAGILTIIVSAYLFKKGFEKAEPKAQDVIRSDVLSYVNDSESQVFEWLKTVLNVFNEELKNFYNSRSININGNVK